MLMQHMVMIPLSTHSFQLILSAILEVIGKQLYKPDAHLSGGEANGLRTSSVVQYRNESFTKKILCKALHEKVLILLLEE
jgi:hypothetical protein